MTKFMLLNFPEYNINQDFPKMKPVGTSFCVCCLDRSGLLINLGSCLHTEFLANVLPSTFEMAICVYCHSMLVKINTFKKQIKENLQKLLDQTENLKPNKKLNNLQISTPQATFNFGAEDSKCKIDTIEFETEVKVEIDSTEVSDEDTSLPLSEIKKEICRKRKIIPVASRRVRQVKKKHSRSMQFEEKYQGKINLVSLTPKQLHEERESDRLKDTYMKLPYKCEQCVRGFDHEATLVEHRGKQHTYRKGNFKCDICTCYLSSESSLKEHCRRHYKRYECVRCKKRNNTLQAVIAHYNETHGVDDDVITTAYTCHDCGITLTSNRAYRYHIEKHKGKEQCSDCGKKFVNKHGLKTHMLTIHKKSSRVYSCAPCGKVYKAKSGWLLHIAAHHETSAAYCVPCRTHYRTESILRHHLRTHSSHVTDTDKKFVCCECGDKFLTQPTLNEHVDWVHLKKAQHTCTKCDKVFKNKSALRKHSNFVHEKKRPPKNKICDHCGRGFTTLQILRSHVRTHTGERPLKCNHCDATFAHPSALYTHNKLIHTAHARKAAECDATVAS